MTLKQTGVMIEICRRFARLLSAINQTTETTCNSEYEIYYLD